MEAKTLLKHFRAVLGVYSTRGFKVTIIMADNQFEPLRGELADMGALINVVSRDEHVPDIERYIRTVKERVRSQHSVLPFRTTPPIVIIELVYMSVFWRNMFPIKGGVSKTQSPSELILNRSLDYNSHCKRWGNSHTTYWKHTGRILLHPPGHRPTHKPHCIH
jgi:hypothetical protein